MKWMYRLFLLLIVGCVLIACKKGEEVVLGPNEVAMEYKNFHPFQLTIAVGDTVTFRNISGGTHFVSGSSISSGDIKIDQNWSHVFTEKGQYNVQCIAHGNMQEQTYIKVE